MEANSKTPATPPSQGFFTDWPKALILGLCFFLLALMSSALSRVTNDVAFIWMPNAIAFAFLLRSSGKTWPLLIIVALLGNISANLHFGDNLAVAAGLSFANGIEYTLGAWLVSKLVPIKGGTLSLNEALKILGLYILVAAPISAVLGAATISLAYGTPYLDVFRNWWLGEMIGALFLLPPGILITSQWLQNNLKLRNILQLLLGILFLLVFSHFSLQITSFPFIIMVIPLCIIATTRGTIPASITAISSVTIYGLLILSGGISFRPEILQVGARSIWAAVALVCLFPILVGVASDKLKANSRELSDSEARFRDVIKFAGTGFLLANTDGYILEANAYFCNMLGYTREEMIGKHHTEITHPEDKALANIQRKQALNNPDGVHEQEKRYAHKDGRTVFAYIKVSKLKKSNQETEMIVQVNDLFEKQGHEEQITTLTERLALATQSVEMGVWEWKIQSNELIWDELMYKLYGIDPAEGSNTYNMWRDRLHPEDRDRAEQLIQDTIAGLAEYKITFRVVEPGGNLRYISAAAILVKNENDEPVRMVGINRDITEEIRTEQSLSRALKQAEMASQAKSEFLANMSHEIRTPLNAVLGAAYLMNHSILTPDQRNNLDMIRTSGEALLGILNDILDISKIEAGRMEISLEAFYLDDVLSALGTIMSVTAGKKPIELMFGVSPDVPQGLVGDALRLQQVLINLAGNAVKFTEEGEVTVLVDLVRKEQDEAILKFEVRDTGIGITREQLERLFAPFTQADASTTRKFGGTGLGLTISRRLLEMMGGQLQVSSVKDEGSCFFFELPFDLSPRTESRNNDTLADLSILLVEDNKTTRHILATTMQAWGWQVESFESADKARLHLKDASETSYDVVLLDWATPNTDGPLLIKQIRELPSEKRIPIVIMVNAFAREQLLQTEQAKIADSIIIKPTTASTLFDNLHEIIDQNIQNKQAPLSLLGKTKIDLSGHKILLTEDNFLNQSVARGILELAGAELDIVDDGKQAVAQLRENPSLYDLVLMDIQMPVMDGFTATKIIRNELKLKLPIIAMTAGVMESQRDQCIESGMNDFISKPMKVDSMLQIIANYLPGTSHKPNPTSPTEEQPEQPRQDEQPEPETTFDPDKLYNLFKKNETHRETYLTIISNVVTKGTEALDQAKTALANQNRKEAAQIFHTMRGSLGTLGASNLVKITREIETAILDEADEKVETLFENVYTELNDIISISREWLKEHQ